MARRLSYEYLMNRVTRIETPMQRRSLSPHTRTQVVAISGITLIAILAAILLPFFVAAPILLLALFTIRVVAEIEPVVDPVVIRRDHRR